jgi:hypothetical protein
MPRKFKIQIVMEIHIIIFNSSQSETRYWIIDPGGHSFKTRNTQSKIPKGVRSIMNTTLSNIVILTNKSPKGVSSFDFHLGAVRQYGDFATDTIHLY